VPGNVLLLSDCVVTGTDVEVMDVADCCAVEVVGDSTGDVAALLVVNPVFSVVVCGGAVAHPTIIIEIIIASEIESLFFITAPRNLR